MLRRYIIYIVLLTLVPAIAAADTFSHYLGIANTTYDSRGMQRVAEVHYYYYVSDTGGSFTLSLPLSSYSANGNDDEPRNYFRWYDYSTDRASSNLTANGSMLKAVSDSEGNARGLIAINLFANGNKYPSQSTVGVTYNPPVGATDENWEGDIVACDVSRYNDFGGKGGAFTAEPTLSIRYIYHILPGKRMAENIIKTTSTDLRDKYSDLTIEDNKRIVFGAKNADSRMMVRTNMPQNRYYFYALKNTNHHVYSADEAHKITSADFDRSKLYASDGIYWRAYDQTMTKYTDVFSWYVQLPTTGFGMKLIQDNGNGWRTLDGARTTKPTINFGDVVYLVAFARSGKSGPYAPIANYEILFQDTYPKTRAEIIADGNNERMIDYLDEHYQQAMKPISFDDDNDEMDFTAPTTPDNNMSRLPSKWDRRSYGFTYRDLKAFAPSGKYWKSYTPLHGEYGLYKSANLKGVSDYASEYVWWKNDTVVYDRTYESTGGKQYGHFLYIDASDETRQIAAADFKANLCSGARLIFTGFINDFTTSYGTQPQVLFKLYGIIRDDNDNITDQRLIVSFSSGDFTSNLSLRQMGKWFQVYSRVVLPRNTGVENYSDFRIVIDNMCYSTVGADYLIDDLRLYITPAKVDAVQNKPICPSESGYKETPKHVTLKLRAHYDIMQGMVGNKQSVVYYRIADADGNPVEGIDYDGDGKPDLYGTAEIPAAYDATKMLPPYAADGSTTTPMFDIDTDNHTLVVFANRNFNLPMGKDFYVSVAYPDEDNDGKPGAWGVPTNVCSTYSEMFQMVQQTIVITDSNGNVVTTVRVSCDADRTPNVKINGKLETADPVNGGKITLGNVKFDWFIGLPNEDNDFQQIAGLQEALTTYRAAYPDATTLEEEYAWHHAEGYALLKKYVDNGQLVLSANNNLSNYKFGKNMIGIIKIAAIPIATDITEGKTTYEICPDPMYFSIRIVEDGPKLTMGFTDVIYPNDDRTVRIGLPQIRAMLAKGKNLILPVTSLESSKSIVFENNSDVFISDTNDPTWDNTKQIIAHVKNDGLTTSDHLLSIAFSDNAADILHEGYWYELNFSFRQNRIGSEEVVSCPGETFITFKIVPEYLTWNSTSANKLNANWNNDLNFMRSTAAQLYKSDYTDYATSSLADGSNNVETTLVRQQAYVPMKFSKVTIVDMTGKTYPLLGNITYRAANHIATKLTNSKGENATADIQYDMVVKWNYLTADHSDTGDGTFSCETFEGNVCDEIYFKPHTELLNPCYLVYNRAYVEKELSTNEWYLASSPLRNTYAGDMYVPSATGRQETEAFQPIAFDAGKYSRTERPFYQRAWDGHVQEVVDGLTYYEGHDYNGTSLRIDTITDNSLNVESLYWSHVYNKVDEAYANGQAFSIKAGDIYHHATDDTKWLLRLPKADTQYGYFTSDGSESSLVATLNRSDNYRFVVDPSTSADENSPVTQQLQSNVHSANDYFLVGNPYTASLSVAQFLKGNPALANKIWTLDNGILEAHVIAADASSDRTGDVFIEPMQGFFVKKRDDATTDEVLFTSAMTVERWVNGGVAQQSPASKDADMTLTASDGERMSKALVRIDDNADNAYDDTEDVEMLATSDLDDVPQVYTVATDEAVQVNTLRNADWLPLGVVAKNTESVKLTFGLSRRMSKRQYYLFDSSEDTFTPIADSTSVYIDANQHGRYFITTEAAMPQKTAADASSIRCYSMGDGRIVVSSLTDALDAAIVYDADGHVVASATGIGSTRHEMQCAVRGVYIVKATTVAGTSVTRKIVVR